MAYIIDVGTGFPLSVGLSYCFFFFSLSFPSIRTRGYQRRKCCYQNSVLGLTSHPVLFGLNPNSNSARLNLGTLRTQVLIACMTESTTRSQSPCGSLRCITMTLSQSTKSLRYRCAKATDCGGIFGVARCMTKCSLRILANSPETK